MQGNDEESREDGYKFFARRKGTGVSAKVSRPSDKSS